MGKDGGIEVKGRVMALEKTLYRKIPVIILRSYRELSFWIVLLNDGLMLSYTLDMPSKNNGRYGYTEYKTIC